MVAHINKRDTFGEGGNLNQCKALSGSVLVGLLFTNSQKSVVGWVIE